MQSNVKLTVLRNRLTPTAKTRCKCLCVQAYLPHEHTPTSHYPADISARRKNGAATTSKVCRNAVHTTKIISMSLSLSINTLHPCGRGKRGAHAPPDSRTADAHPAEHRPPLGKPPFGNAFTDDDHRYGGCFPPPYHQNVSLLRIRQQPSVAYVNITYRRLSSAIRHRYPVPRYAPGTPCQNGNYTLW